jgi:hypothetical protein
MVSLRKGLVFNLDYFKYQNARPEACRIMIKPELFGK